MYDRFTSQTEAQAHAEHIARERELDRLLQNQFALSPLEPGSGPGAGVIDYYVDGTLDGGDSAIQADSCDKDTSDAGSYVMQRDFRQSSQPSECGSGSGNMMVDRLLQDLRVNDEEFELQQRRMTTRSQAATGGQSTRDIDATEDLRIDNSWPIEFVQDGPAARVPVTVAHKIQPTSATLQFAQHPPALGIAIAQAGDSHAELREEEIGYEDGQAVEDEAVEVIREQDLTTSGSRVRTGLQSSDSGSTKKLQPGGPRTNKAALLRWVPSVDRLPRRYH